MRSAAAMIAALGLAPHPEGGFYRETFRSAHTVSPADGRGPRAALTTIFFLLPGGAVSRWHRVRSDEVWHFYEGAPLELWTAAPDGRAVERHLLGRIGDGWAPVHAVARDRWQAARSTGDYTLVGCTVGPGFDFTDFAFAAGDPAVAAALRSAGRAPGELL